MKNVILAMGLEPVLVPPIVAFASTLYEAGFEVRVVYGEVKGIPVDYALPFATCSCVVKKSDLKLSNKLKIPGMISEQIANFTDENTVAVFSFDPISLQGINKRLSRKLKVFYWQFELYSKERTKLASLDYWRLMRIPTWIKKNVYMVIAPSETRLKSICEMFQVPENVLRAAVYNCKRFEPVDFKQIDNASSADLMRELQAWTKSFSSVAIYSGNISEVAYLIELLDAYEQMPECGIIFAGTVAASFHKYFYDKLPLLPNIKFVGALDLDTLAQVQALCDIGFCFYNSRYGGELADPAPNKIGDYIAGNLWVIASGQAFIQTVLHPNNVGIALQDISGNTIVAAIHDLMNRKNFKHPQHIQDYYKSDFNMQVQSKAVLQHLI